MRAHKAACLLPMLPKDQLDALAEDIKANGLLHPIALIGEQILDGRNRFAACKIAGVKPRFTQVNPASPVAYVTSENLARRHLTESQRAAYAVEALPELEREAKKRQQAQAARGKEGGRGKKKTLEEKVPQGLREPQVRDQAGKLFGVSGRYVSDAKSIKYKAPRQFSALLSGSKTITEIKRDLAKKAATERAAEMPCGKFRVIYADPPWKYNDTLGGTIANAYGAAENHYPTMTISELCHLPIKAKSASDSVLFLWVTSPLLFEAYAVIKAWGYNYKASFVWDKVKHNLGRYNSVRHEFLLICTKGSCTPDVRKLFDSVQSIERTKKHSEKPEEFRRIIDTIYPHGKRVELFARKKVKGWEVYSNEVK